MSNEKPEETIAVCGVRFSATEVKSVVVERDGRCIEISAKDDKGTVVGGFGKGSK